LFKPDAFLNQTDLDLRSKSREPCDYAAPFPLASQNQGKNQTIKVGKHRRILLGPLSTCSGQHALTVNRQDRSPQKVQTPEVQERSMAKAMKPL
jgi:hypothetical protein